MDDPAQQPPPANPSPAPLTYEETPVITAEEQPASPTGGQTTEEKPKKHSGSCLKTIGIIALVVLLFVGGIWLSSFVRQFLPAGQSPLGGAQPSKLIPTPSTSVITDPYSTWKTYTVISGVTKLPIPGLQFKLPPDVLSPICDGTTCVSQGAYLPGGTRLTVAARGTGQSLRDFRGTVITDANGIPIPTKLITVGNFSVTEYDSSASGQTVSGYAFTHILGVMIPLTDTLSVEVNHFTPSGITADFTSDDTLFDSIVNTFTYNASTPGASPTLMITSSPTPFLTATSSGH